MHVRSVAASIGLAILAVAIHGTALSGWWLYDDPALLIESIRQPTWAVLFHPAEYAHLSATTFTPLLLLSFKFDLLIHGLDPTVFYAHQLFSLIVALVLLYFLLRRYISDLYAAAGSAVFLTTWASVYAARTLMIRHYVEGLVFALAALLAWSYGRRWAVAGAAFYILAMLSKEVYAPIPLFLIAQERYDGRGWREIARGLVLPAAACIIFLTWRWYMTGLTGTYASVIPAPDLVTFPRALWIHLVGPAPLWPRVVWGVCIVIALAAFLFRHRLGALGFLVIVAAAAIAPILPLAANFEWRYSFAFVTFVVIAMTIALGTLGRWAMAIMLVILGTTATMSIHQRHHYEDLTRRGIEQEGRYVWMQRQDAPPLAAASPGWYLDGLAWLRRYQHRGDAPRFVFSRYAITTGAIDPQRLVAVDAGGRLIPATRTNLFGTAAEWERAQQQYDPAAPLVINFALRNHDAQWRLGPLGGRFIFLTDPGYSAIPIPPVGKQRVPAARDRQYFRILREDDNGTWTVSPRLPVPADGSAIVWQRQSKLKVLLDRHADDFLESLRVRFDRSRRLVEKDALHAKEWHEHGDQIEIRLVAACDLSHPVFE